MGNDVKEAAVRSDWERSDKEGDELCEGGARLRGGGELSEVEIVGGTN